MLDFYPPSFKCIDDLNNDNLDILINISINHERTLNIQYIYVTAIYPTNSKGAYRLVIGDNFNSSRILIEE